MDKPDQQRDFFVSYSGADAASAEWTADTLEDAGYTAVACGGAGWVGESRVAI